MTSDPSKIVLQGQEFQPGEIGFTFHPSTVCRTCRAGGTGRAGK